LRSPRVWRAIPEPLGYTGRSLFSFLHADNTLLLAEAAGLGSADLSRIEVAGLPIKEARVNFGPGAIGKRVFS
jgi:hypothetical protein